MRKRQWTLGLDQHKMVSNTIFQRKLWLKYQWEEKQVAGAVPNRDGYRAKIVNGIILD